MTKGQENQHTMFITVMTVLDENAAIIEGMPAFVAVKTRLAAQMGQIDAKIVERENLTVGKVETKSAARIDLETTMKVPAGRLISYSARVKNLELLGQTRHLMKKLYKVRDTEISIRAMSLAGLLSGALAQLADFGVTAADVTVLQSKAAAYASAMSSKEVAFVSRKTAVAMLKDLFRSTRMLLKMEMDPLAESCKVTHAQFYSDYRNARRIKNLGLRSRPTPEAPPTE